MSPDSFRCVVSGSLSFVSLIHSAACRPQPKAAIPRWSGFDLESQDLQPDDQVNHSDGAAMNGFVDLHGESITGVINTFDRVIFKGHLNGFFPDGAFGRYLSRRSVLLKDAGRFFETQQIRDHVVSLAAAVGRPVESLIRFLHEWFSRSFLGQL